MAGKTDYKNKWQIDNHDRFTLLLPKDSKDKIKAHAKSTGYDSLNAYINDLIEKDMDK